MTDDIFKKMAGLEKSPKQKPVRMTPTKMMSEALTAQSLLARILKTLKEELETSLMPPEIKERLCRVLTSNEHNYRYARTNILTLFDYAIKKRIIN